MEFLAGAAPYLAAGGTALQVAGTIAGGRNQEAMADYQAGLMESQANDELAASQREAIDARRQSRLAQSRARAVAASSGAGADDKTVLDIMEGIEQEGEYRALGALYSGQSRAEQMRSGAGLRRAEGRSARRASSIDAAGTLLGQGASLIEKYG